MSLVLIGAGGHAQVVFETAHSCGRRLIGFLDDKVDNFLGLEKLSKQDFLKRKKDFKGIISFGAVRTETAQHRHSLFQQYKEQGIYFDCLISKQAIISPLVKIGNGTTIFAGTIINAGAVIGENVIVNTATIIEHDAMIGPGSHICPGSIVLGGAKVGKNCIIGSGAVILPGAEVPPRTLVSALTRFPK